MSLERRTSGQEFASPAELRPELVIPPEVEAERPIMTAIAFGRPIHAVAPGLSANPVQYDIVPLYGYGESGIGQMLELRDQQTTVLQLVKIDESLTVSSKDRTTLIPITKDEFEETWVKGGTVTKLGEPVPVFKDDAALYATADFIAATEKDIQQVWEWPNSVRLVPAAGDTLLVVAIGPRRVLEAKLDTTAAIYLDLCAKLTLQAVENPHTSDAVLRRIVELGLHGQTLVRPNNLLRLDYFLYVGLSCKLLDKRKQQKRKQQEERREQKEQEQEAKEWNSLLEALPHWLNDEQVTLVQTRVEEMAAMFGTLS